MPSSRAFVTPPAVAAVTVLHNAAAVLVVAMLVYLVMRKGRE